MPADLLMIPPASARLSLSLQLVFSLLTLGFGILAMRVAPKPGRSVRLGAWYLTGVTFTLNGAFAVLSAVLAVPVAFFQDDARLIHAWLQYQTIANDARAFSVFGYALMLAWMVYRRRPAPPFRSLAAILAALLVVGAFEGVLEGLYEPAKQFGVMSMVGTATVLVLFAGLYAALVRTTMDWPLWTALGIYAVRESMNSVVQAAVTAGLVANTWGPAPRTILWLGAVSMVMMIVCTFARLGWTRGMEPPALLERLRG